VQSKFFVVLFSLLQVQSIAQDLKGNHFWFGFMENQLIPSRLEIMVIAEQSTNVSITVQGVSTIFNAGIGSNIFNLPISDFYPLAGSEMIDNRGIEVISNNNTRLYALNYDFFTADATPIIPFNNFINGDSYVVQSLEGNINIGSSFLVVSTEDNSQITITPSANTVGGLTAGSAFDIILQKGQSFIVNAANSGDLSGSRIKGKNGCGKFMVFMGSKCAPSGVAPCSGCDHLFTHAVPISHFGNQYHTFPFTNQLGGYLLKITASTNNTAVTINNTTIATINAGQSISYEPTLTNLKLCISTSKPTLLMQYMKSRNCNGDTGQLGDPSAIFIPQKSRWVKSTEFSFFNQANFSQHHSNIILHKNGLKSLKIFSSNGHTMQIDSANICDDILIVNIKCNMGLIKINCDSNFYSYAYSRGDRVSNAFLTGATFFPYNTSIDIQEKRVCLDEQPILLSLDTDSFFTSLWDMGDGSSYANQKSISHSYSRSGKYNAKLIFRYASSNCPLDTLPIHIEILPKVILQDIKDVIVCPGENISISIFDQPNYSYKWSDGVIGLNRKFSVLDNYSLTAIDSNGCTSEKFFIVKDSGCFDKKLTLYNFFSPNEDAINRTWQPIFKGYSALNYEIFNRYGTIIYKGDLVKNEFWNGKINNEGAECATGTYFYHIVTQEKYNGKQENIYGVITLLR